MAAQAGVQVGMKRGGVTNLASEALMFDRNAGREHEMQQLLAVESVGASICDGVARGDLLSLFNGFSQHLHR